MVVGDTFSDAFNNKERCFLAGDATSAATDASPKEALLLSCGVRHNDLRDVCGERTSFGDSGVLSEAEDIGDKGVLSDLGEE